MMQLLFLYGAGPLPLDLAQTCRALQLPAHSLRSLDSAYLPDFEPIWRMDPQGEVQLAARPAPACLVPGLLVEATPPAAQALRNTLNLKWSIQMVLNETGGVVPAWLASVALGQVAVAEPTHAALQQVQGFLNTWKIDPLPATLAATGQPVPPLCDVFAYGTLREGEPNAPLLGSATSEPCYMNGSLWSLGAYPVLTPAREPQRVMGELRHAPELTSRLVAIDHLEDFTGYHDKSMYWRVLGRVHAASGSKLAWLWQMDEVPAGAVAILSGDWRDRLVR